MPNEISDVRFSASILNEALMSDDGGEESADVLVRDKFQAI
jgi:hypothetical protein